LRIIKSIVEDAGFSVGSLVLFTDFENLEVESDYHHTIGEITYHFMGTKKQILQKGQGLKVIDKGFVTEKEYKKYLKMSSKYSCYKTGKMENVKYLYHVTVL
jgi:hypothetical protein